MNKINGIFPLPEKEKKKFRASIVHFLTAINVFLMLPVLSCNYFGNPDYVPTKDQPEEKENADILTADMRSFSVEYPGGDKWICEQDHVKKAVVLTKYKKNFITRMQNGSIKIVIAEQRDSADISGKGHKESARYHFRKEQKILKDKSYKKDFDSGDLFTYNTQVNGIYYYCLEHLYSLEYTSTSGGINYGYVFAIHFPDDYTDNGIYYSFQITDLDEPCYILPDEDKHKREKQYREIKRKQLYEEMTDLKIKVYNAN